MLKPYTTPARLAGNEKPTLATPAIRPHTEEVLHTNPTMAPPVPKSAVRQAIMTTVIQHVEDELDAHSGACTLRSMLIEEFQGTFNRAEIDRALDDAAEAGLLVVEGVDVDVAISLPASEGAS